jgi:hypothetical protein
MTCSSRGCGRPVLRARALLPSCTGSIAATLASPTLVDLVHERGRRDR